MLLVTAALLVPLLLLRRPPGVRAGRPPPSCLVVFGTLLTSQPAAASTWVFILVALALACDELTDAERTAPGALPPRRPASACWARSVPPHASEASLLAPSGSKATSSPAPSLPGEPP